MTEERSPRTGGAGADSGDDDPEAVDGDERTETDRPADASAAGGEDGDAPPSTFTRVRRLLAGIPAFGTLLYRLLGDERVSLLDKVIFGTALAYLFVPVDLVPDWVPALGQMDDLLIVLFTLDRLLRRTDEAVLAEHWPADPASFRALLSLLDRAVGVLPGWARKLLRAG